MARSAADKAAAFVIAWPPRDGPRGLARHAMVRVEGDRPFPYVPPDALNDQVFDVSMFHVIKKSGADRIVPPSNVGNCGYRSGLPPIA
jgi:hypothetical protein